MSVYQGSLNGLIEETKQHPLLKYASIAQQVSSGLAEMHKIGIVHCDIKKNNVLYKFDKDEKIRTFITDFGVAQVLLAAEKVHKRVNVNIKALSVAYADPQSLQMWKSALREDAKIEHEVNLNIKESAVTERQALPSRDLYALGILMWELLFRRKAWDGLPMRAVLEQVVVK